MENLKKQTAKIGGAGSFINQMMANNSTVPVVGKGATELHYTDRTCYEVVEVSADGKTAKIEYLSAVYDKSKSGSGFDQEWLLQPTGVFYTVQWRNGKWKKRFDGVEFTKQFSAEIANRRLTKEEQAELFDDYANLKIVEGKTESKTTWQPIKILFGQKNYYYDWSF